MTITVSEVTSNQSFGVWLTRTNQIAAIMTSNAVTADASNTGSVTTGNTYVNGYFVADHLIANSELRGGTANVSGPLFVSSNTLFRNSGANVLVITSNTNNSNIVSNANFVTFGGNTFTSVAVNTNIGGTLYVNADSSTFTKQAAFQNTVSITGNTSLGNTLYVTGNAVFGNTANVTGAAAMANTLGVTGAVTFSNTLAVTGNTTLSNTLAVTGAATLSNTLSVTGNTVLSNTLYVTGNTVLSNTLNVTGLATLNGINATVANVANVNATDTIKVTGGSFLANGTTVNSASFTIGTISAANGLYANATYVATGNSTVNTVITPANVTTNTVYCYNMQVDGVIIGTFTANGNIIPNSNNSQFIGNAQYVFASLFASNVYTKNVYSQSGIVYINANTSQTGNAVFSNTLSVTGAVTMSNTLGVTGNANVGGTLGVTGAVTLSNTLSVVGAANLQTTLGVGGNANVAGTLRVSTDFSVSGNVTSTLNTSANNTSFGNTTYRWLVYGTAGNFNNGLTVTGSNSSFNTNLLFINAANNRIGIGNATPNSTLTVAGTIEMTSAGLKFSDGSLQNTAFTAGGSNTQIQFFDSSVAYNLNGSNDLVYNKATNVITANNLTVTNTTITSAAITVIRANTNITGTFGTNSIGYQSATSFTFSNTSGATVDSFAAASYRAAEFLISMQSGTNYHSSKILLLHDGSTSYITEYGSLLTGSSLGTISSTVSGGNVNLVITPAVGNVAVKIVRNVVAV